MITYKALKDLLMQYKGSCIIISHFISDVHYCLMEDGSDLDILCKNRKIKNQLAKDLSARKVFQNRLSNAYYFFVDNKKIHLDLFVIDDGFYPKRWCKRMLQNGTLRENMLFLNENDNKYSCLYHQFFHKNEIDEKGFNKMQTLFSANDNIALLKNKLLCFMKQNKYFFTATLDWKRVNNISDPDIKELFNYPMRIRIIHHAYHFLTILRRVAVHLKNIISMRGVKSGRSN